MKTLTTAIAFALALGLSLSAHGDAPCRDKRQALKEARVALRDCNKAWTESIRGQAADPSDDCAAKQTAFVAAVKDIKACVKQAKADREAKRK